MVSLKFCAKNASLSSFSFFRVDFKLDHVIKPAYSMAPHTLLQAQQMGHRSCKEGMDPSAQFP